LICLTALTRDRLLCAIGESQGMLGFSGSALPVNNGSDCTLEEFCQMIMPTEEMIGIDRLGIGSGRCENGDY
jgi:membrane dipeptidase